MLRRLPRPGRAALLLPSPDDTRSPEVSGCFQKGCGREELAGSLVPGPLQVWGGGDECPPPSVWSDFYCVSRMWLLVSVWMSLTFFLFCGWFGGH